ncbi:Nickel import system ATP-binding protein NikE OS=Lysinibacillus sphaericus OX=1421 GN=LS41612_05990 PE=3 SV=1 [Lysinibacillus sphaericus]
MSIQKIVPPAQQESRMLELMALVGLRPEYLERYPHEFSGGQRQRIGIARALAVNPKIIICDESVSALDVSIQAQILNLLKKLQRELDLTFLFISHDLSVVRHISDRVMVMYLGKVVEIADKKSLFSQPLHPYTKALLSSIPIIDKQHRKERIILKGDIPSPLNPPTGCSFHTRCPFATDKCRVEVPALREIKTTQKVACDFAENLV